MDIKEYFGDTQTYKEAQKIFRRELSRYTTISNLTGDENISTISKILLSRQEIIGRTWNAFKFYNTETYNYLLEEGLTPPSEDLSPEEYKEAKIQYEQEKELREKALKALGNRKVFVEFLKGAYAGLKVKLLKDQDAIKISYDSSLRNKDSEEQSAKVALSSDPSSERDQSTQEEVTDEYDDKAELVNPTRRASLAVKDFMYTIRREHKDGSFSLVDPSRVFVYLLHGLSDIDPYAHSGATSSIKNEIGNLTTSFRQVGNVRKDDYSSDLGAVYNKVRGLVKTSYDMPQNPNFELGWVGDNLQGHYRFIDKKNNKILHLNSGRGNSSNIFQLSKYMETLPEEDRMSTDDLIRLHNAHEAADILGSLYSVANSLRRRFPMMVYYSKGFIRDEKTDKVTPIKSFDYTPFLSENNRLLYTKQLKNRFTGNIEPLLSLLPQNLLMSEDKRFTDELLGNIMGEYDLGNVNTLSKFSKEDLKRALIKIRKPIQEIANDPERWENDPAYRSNIESDLKYATNLLLGFVTSLGELNMDYNSSYKGGDGNSRWFWQLGSNITDRLYGLIHGTEPLHKSMQDIRYTSNPFVRDEQSMHRIGYKDAARPRFNQLFSSTIKEIVDHDSISPAETSIFDKPISYLDETPQDRDIRNFTTGFLRYLMKENKEGGEYYIQQLYTPSNSRSLVSAKVLMLNRIETKDWRLPIATIWKQWADNLNFYEKSNKIIYKRLLDNPPMGVELTQEEKGKIRQALGNKTKKEIIDEESEELSFRSPLADKIVTLSRQGLHRKFLEDYSKFTEKNVPIPTLIGKMGERMANSLILSSSSEDFPIDLGNEEEISLGTKKTLQTNIQYYVGSEGIQSRLSNDNRIEPLQEEDQEIYDSIMKPMYYSFWMNNYFNGHFLNQLTSGFNEEYKDSYDHIKRESSANGMGSKARISNENGTPEKFKVLILEDQKTVIDEDTPILSMFPAMRTGEEGVEITDAQSFAVPFRLEQLRRGYSRYFNLGETLKNLHSGVSTEGHYTNIKTSTRVLSDAMVRKDMRRRSLRKQMEFGRIPSGISDTILGTYYSDIKSLAETTFNKMFREDNPSEETQILYRELLQWSHDKGYMAHEATFPSAIKTGMPTTVYGLQWNDKTQEYTLNKKLTPQGEKALGHKDASQEKDPILELYQSNYRIQLNPRKEESHNVEALAPQQVLYQLVSDVGNQPTVANIYRLLERVHSMGLIKVRLSQFGNKDGVQSPKEQKRFLLESIKTLSDVEGQENLANQLQALIENPSGAMNLGLASVKLAQTLLSAYNKATVRYKAPGGSYVLETSALMENPPQLVFTLRNKETGEILEVRGRNEKAQSLLNSGSHEVVSFYGEAHVPRSFLNKLNISSLKGKSDQEIIKYLRDNHLDELVGYRVPSTGLHSTMPLRITGFNESEAQDNIITVPQEVVILHGSGYDGDKLFIMDRYIPQKDIKIPYITPQRRVNFLTLRGGIPLDKNERPKDFLKDKSISELLTENLYNRTLQAIEQELDKPLNRRALSHKEAEEALSAYQSILYDNLQMDLLSLIKSKGNLNNMMVPTSLAPISDLKDPNSIFSKIKANITTEDKQGLIRPGAIQVDKPKRDLDSYEDQSDFFKDNAMAASLVEIFATMYRGVSNTIHAAQNNWNETTLDEDWKKIRPSLNPENYLNWNGRMITSLGDKIHGQNYDWAEQINMIINAAIDHVKEQILNVFNIDASSANTLISMTMLGLPLDEITYFINQPILQTYFKGKRRKRTSYIDVENIYTRQILEKEFPGKSISQEHIEKYKRENFLDSYEEIEEGTEVYYERASTIKEVNTPSKVRIRPPHKISLEKMMQVIGQDMESMNVEELKEQVRLIKEFQKIERLNIYFTRIALITGTAFGLNQKKDLGRSYDTYNEYMALEKGGGPLKNINIKNVPHLASIGNVLGNVIDDAHNLFLRNNKVIFDFIINSLEPYLNNNGLTVEAAANNLKEDAAENSPGEGVSSLGTEKNPLPEIKADPQELRQNPDVIFVDENISRDLPTYLPNSRVLGMSRLDAIQTLADKLISYFLPMAELKSSWVNMPFNTKNQAPAPIIKYTIDPTSEEGRKMAKPIELTGVAAWNKAFLRDGYTIHLRNNTPGISLNDRSVPIRVLSLNELIERYKDQNRVIGKLSPNSSFNKIYFSSGYTLDAVEKVALKEEISALNELAIYEDGEGNLLNSRELSLRYNQPIPEYNHLLAGLTKYSVINEGLSFGTLNVSSVLPENLLVSTAQSLSKIVHELGYRGRSTKLLSDKAKPLYNLETIAENFANKFLLTQKDFLKKDVYKYLQKEGNTRKPKSGVLQTEDGEKIFYDLNLVIPSGEESQVSRRNIIAYGNNIYYRAKMIEESSGEKSLFFQRMGSAQGANSYYSDISNLTTPYNIGTKFEGGTPQIGITNLEKNKSNRYETDISPDTLSRYTTSEGDPGINPGDTIFLHLKSDIVRESSQKFILEKISEPQNKPIKVLGKKGKYTEVSEEYLTLTLRPVNSSDNTLINTLIDTNDQSQGREHIPTREEALNLINTTPHYYISEEEKKKIKLGRISLEDLKDKSKVFLLPNSEYFIEGADPLDAMEISYTPPPNVVILYIQRDNQSPFRRGEKEEFRQLTQDSLNLLKAKLQDPLVQEVIIPNKPLGIIRNPEGKASYRLPSGMEHILNQYLLEIGLDNTGLKPKMVSPWKGNILNLSLLPTAQRTLIENNLELLDFIKSEASKEEKEQALRCYLHVGYSSS